MRLLFRFILLTLAVFAAGKFISGIHLDNYQTILIAGAALTLIQIIVKPIVKVLAIPITIVTLGLFLIVLNVLFFWFVGRIVPGMSVDTFTAAFFGSLIVSVANWLFDHLFKKRD